MRGSEPVAWPAPTFCGASFRTRAKPTVLKLYSASYREAAAHAYDSSAHVVGVARFLVTRGASSPTPRTPGA